VPGKTERSVRDDLALRARAPLRNDEWSLRTWLQYSAHLSNYRRSMVADKSKKATAAIEAMRSLEGSSRRQRVTIAAIQRVR
jgi:hypothetical protein